MAEKLFTQSMVERNIDLINNTMDKHQVITDPNLSDILEADRWARIKAKALIQSH